MSLSQQTSRRSNIPSHIFIGLLLLLLATNMRLASSAPLVLYEDVNFKGKTSRYQVGKSTTKGECINLVGKLNDYFSSVDTLGGCFYLCEHRNCRGKCEIVRGKIADLSNINLNDRVSSIRMCSGLPNTRTTATTTLKKKKQRWQKMKRSAAAAAAADEEDTPTFSPLAEADT